MAQVLAASNRNNKPKDITGALVFDDLWFLQVLEGERDVVWSTFERIKEDERHAQVTLVEMREIEDRMFGNWWMGLVTRNEVTEAAFKPYLASGRLQPETMPARKMLALIVEVSKLGLAREIKKVDAA